jgi:hypothetical protein
MKEDGNFQQSLIQYLEVCQKGEFLTGTLKYVKAKIPIDIENQTKGIHTILKNKIPNLTKKSYKDPTQTLPEKPPKSCESNEYIHLFRPPFKYFYTQTFTGVKHIDWK